MHVVLISKIDFQVLDFNGGDTLPLVDRIDFDGTNNSYRLYQYNSSTQTYTLLSAAPVDRYIMSII